MAAAEAWLHPLGCMLLHPRRGPAPGPITEPTELLLACHGRIREFVGIGARITAALDAPPEDIASAASRVLRYFREALPLHEEDEEVSIMPRLLASPARAAVEDALAEMVTEHALAHAILDELIPLWSRLQDEPTALDGIRAPLFDGQHALRVLFDLHLAREERTIVPAIARELDGPTRRTILEEIRARRGGGM